MYKAVGSFLTAASPPTVYDLLTDYPTLPRIFTSIAECREEAGKEGDSLLRQVMLGRLLPRIKGWRLGPRVNEITCCG